MKVKLTHTTTVQFDPLNYDFKDWFKEALENISADNVDEPTLEEIHDAVRHMLEYDVNAVLDLELDADDVDIEVLDATTG